MKIKSAKITSLRVHKEINIDFDNALTLIGGANESGKSTIAEAIHKTLFLKAKGASTQIKELKSLVSDGSPKVELILESGGISYTLIKRFGHSFTLSAPTIGQLTDEEADRKLSELLKVESGVTGNSYAGKWINLWTWQGKALDNPIGFAAERKQELIQGLQSMGAASVFQSSFDGDIANTFNKKHEENYTSSNKVKANSELDESQKKLLKSTTEFSVKRDLLLRLEDAADALGKAKINIGNLSSSSKNIENELEILEQKKKQLQELKLQQGRQDNDFSTAKDSLKRLTDLDSEIAKNESESKRLNDSLLPRREELNGFLLSMEKLKSEHNELKLKDGEQTKKNQSLRSNIDYLNLRKNIKEYDEELTFLKLGQEEIIRIEEEIKGFGISLARLPKINSSDLKKLTKYDQKINELTAVLNSIVTSITLIDSNQDVTSNGSVLVKGKTQTITEETEITFGKKTKLIIKPGGGTSVSETNKSLEKEVKMYQTELLKLDIKNIDEATKILLEINDLENKIGQSEKVLENKNPEELKLKFSEYLRKKLESEGKIERKKEELSPMDIDTLNSSENLSESIRVLEADLDQLNNSGLKKEIDKIEFQMQKVEKNISANSEEILSDSNLFKNIEGILQHLQQNAGTKDEREVGIKNATLKYDEEKSKLEQVQNQIMSLDPENLDSDLERLNSARIANRGKREELIRNIAALENTLFSDGTDDPHASFNAAQLALENSEINFKNVKKRVAAIELLTVLFKQEQKTLSEVYTKPLSEKIKGYLNFIFGNDINVNISNEAGQFTGISIYRGQQAGAGSIDFDNLSGGTREQVAAAVRLAMAEVLAADFNGSLPILFDDAFAYSDPDRIKVLQRMLYHAASKGLQIIVLTCNPADYELLGAKEIAI